MTQSKPPPPPSRPTRARQRAGKWLLASAVLASALAVGSLVTWTLCVVTAALAVAVFLLWFGAEPGRARPVAGALAGVGLLLTLYTALQCLPMPIGLLAKIAPENADIWARALHPLGESGPAFATISIEPLATRMQVLRGVAYLLAFVGALRIAQRREGTSFLLNLAIACSVVMAVTALVHPAFGAQKVFWVYAPSDSNAIGTRHIAPLVNANHLAAYVNIGLCVALAGAMAPRPSMPRPFLIAGVLFLLGVELWIASRGGLVGMALGVLVVVAMTFAVRQGGHARAARFIALGACVAASVAMIVLSSSSEAWEELADTDVSKLALAEEGMRLARLFPVLGAGRGAFEVAFPAVRTSVGYIAFTHPENVVVQWVTEWGIAVTCLAAIGIGVALRPSSVLARSQPPVGAWAALVAVGAHNLVDFSLEVPAVVIAMAVCAAVITGGSAGAGASFPWSAWSSRTSRVAVAGAALAALAILLVVPGMGYELREERVALRDRAMDVETSRAAFRDLARAAMLRHPGEPYLPLLGAIRAARAKDESIMPWVARTLERAPVYGPAHLLLAQSLYARSPGQARLEYRLALQYDPLTREAFRLEATALVRSFDDAMELVPDGAMRELALVLLLDQLSTRLPATVVRVDQELLRVAPHSADPLRREARASLADLRDREAAPWCMSDRVACAAHALAAATALRDNRPEMCEGPLARASVLIEQGDTKRGLDELEAASARVEDWNGCLHALIDAARAAHEDARVSAALERLTRAGCATDADCVANLAYAAALELDRGNARRALGLYKMAYERNPNDEILAAAASLAARVGLHGEALKDYETLVSHDPKDSRWPPMVAAEREALGHVLAP